MAWYQPKSLLDKVFEYGIIVKGIDGILELFAAILLIFVKPEQIHDFIVLITQKELLNDPNDVVANFFLRSTDNMLNGSVSFIIFYLLIHAVIKIVAVIGILRKQLWAYPFSLITLGVLLLYQFYSIYEKVSIGMVLLTVFDLFIVWLIWREYGTAKFELGKPKDI